MCFFFRVSRLVILDLVSLQPKANFNVKWVFKNKAVIFEDLYIWKLAHPNIYNTKQEYRDGFNYSKSSFLPLSRSYNRSQILCAFTARQIWQHENREAQITACLYAIWLGFPEAQWKLTSIRVKFEYSNLILFLRPLASKFFLLVLISFKKIPAFFLSSFSWFFRVV